MKCEKCKREGAYIRAKTQEVYCRLCGHTEPIKKGAENEPKSPMDTENKE